MKRWIFFFSVLLLCWVSVRADETNALLRRQFIASMTQSASGDSSVETLLNTQCADGTWPDISYESQRRSSWPVRDHLTRLLSLSRAYASPASSFFHDPHTRGAILLGMNHWLDKDYRNPNWWQGKIGVPEAILQIFILMDDELPEEMLHRAQSTVLKRTKIGMTGQNKVWLSGIAFMKALLSDDAQLMHVAGQSIWEELVVSTGEGIQPDWSFHQHGPQQQFGNYGLSFGDRMILWGSVFRDTPYALSGVKREILRSYLLNGAAWTLWNGRMDLSACGRQIDEGCQRDKARGLRGQLEQMIPIDPDCRARYEAALEGPGAVVGHRSFWRSDMAVHRRPDWMATLKMSSVRVIGAETCNSENMLGVHLGDGMLLTSLDATEYEDIVPLWDWHRLPGTTCDQKMNNLMPNGWNKSYGGSDFAGVLNDGSFGLAAMIYRRGDLSARKAWFFEDDAVVCLGAGIGGNTSGPVFTSLQQSWLKGAVTSSSGIVENGTCILSADSWVHHAGIGYQLLDETVCRAGRVAGNWQPVFPTRDDRPVEGKVFSLWVDHGMSPKNVSYAYVMFPHAEAARMNEVIANHQTTVLSNTGRLQAVDGSAGVFAVFYAPGKLTTIRGSVIETDAPCLLNCGGDVLIVQDPTHRLIGCTITIDGKSTSVVFPSGDQAGKPVCIELDCDC